MAILANKRSLKMGLPTSPVHLSVDFMQAVFDIELNYESNIRYSLSGREEDRTYLLHHLTQADLQLAIILQKVCLTSGRLTGLTAAANIYDKIDEYFEEPVCLSQFYASFEKFKRLALIRIVPEPVGNTITIELNNYLQVETSRIGHYTKAHPFIFTKAFSQLSIREQKLFLTFFVQQGVTPGAQKQTFRCFSETVSQHIEYRDLSGFLHANTTHIRDTIQSLATKPIFMQEPLFTKAFYTKDGRSFDKVFVVVNPKLYVLPTGEECHDPIQPKITYKRKANILQRLMEQHGIADILDSLEFNKVVRLLRNAGIGIMKFIVKRLSDRFVTGEIYQAQIFNLVKNEVRNKRKAQIMSLATKYGLSRLVSAGCNGVTEIEDREFEFSSALSIYSDTQIDKILGATSAMLKDKFMVPVSQKSLNYKFDSRLDWINGIHAVRRQAEREFKEPAAYWEMESKYGAAFQVLQLKYNYENTAYHRELSKLVDNMLGELAGLPITVLRPNVDEGFKLEEEILALCGAAAAIA